MTVENERLVSGPSLSLSAWNQGDVAQEVYGQ